MRQKAFLLRPFHAIWETSWHHKTPRNDQNRNTMARIQSNENLAEPGTQNRQVCTRLTRNSAWLHPAGHRLLTPLGGETESRQKTAETLLALPTLLQPQLSQCPIGPEAAEAEVRL